jgi:hypothetical protein
MFNCLRNSALDKENRRQSLKDRKQSLEVRIGLIEEILEHKYIQVDKLLQAKLLNISMMIHEGSEITKKLDRLEELKDELVAVIKELESLDES